MRSALNPYSLQDPEIRSSLSPHKVSQVLTGAMFDILIGVAKKYRARNQPIAEAAPDIDTAEEVAPQEAVAEQIVRTVSPAQALRWAAQRIRQVALQALDFCPPCDIQFIDYAQAVIRNDLVTNPSDRSGYRDLMLQVFHHRGLCTCPFVPGQDLPPDCQFGPVFSLPTMEFGEYSIERVARCAYCCLLLLE